MANTKQKILAASLAVFNGQGLSGTTVRDIATEMGISHGNLCYHYPNIAAIVEALYMQLVSELDEAFEESLRLMQEQGASLPLARAHTERVFRIFLKYKFFMLDFTDIMRKQEGVRQHYRQLQEQRRGQMKGLLLGLHQAGLLRAEQYEGQWLDLIECMTIFGDFWMASSEILRPGTDDEKVVHYSRLFMSQLVPHLTAEGLAGMA